MDLLVNEANRGAVLASWLQMHQELAIARGPENWRLNQTNRTEAENCRRVLDLDQHTFVLQTIGHNSAAAHFAFSDFELRFDEHDTIGFALKTGGQRGQYFCKRDKNHVNSC